MTLISERFFYKCENLFEGVHPEKLAALQKHTQPLVLKESQILFHEGEYPDGLYYLKKGQIKIYQLNSAGKYQIVYIYTHGEYFGFRPMLSASRHPVSAEALEDCEILFIPKDPFMKLLNSSSLLMKNLLFSLSYEFNVWVNLMAAFSHKAVKARVALALLILNEKNKLKINGPQLAINIGRKDLAGFSSTTIETCVRVLTQYRESGIISTSGRKIKLLNQEELLKIAGVS